MTTFRLSRREFLQTAPVAAALATAIRPRLVDAAPSPRWKVIAFSKPFTRLNYDETADLVAEVGWAAIECPVRKTATHIDPDRVVEQLPKMAEALKRWVREVSMITTDITGGNPGVERILRT